MSNPVRILLILLGVVGGVFYTLQRDADETAPWVTDERVGTAAPDFTLPILGSDEHITVSELGGSVVVLDFWATHCAPCRRSMPHVDRIGEQYGEQGVRVISVNADFPEEDRVTKVQQFVDSFGVASEVVIDNGNASYLYGARRIPLIVMIDRDGTIGRVYQGYTDYNVLADGVEALLSPPPS